MTDEVKEIGIIDRGIKADRLINDPLFRESFELVRQAWLAKIEASPQRDVEGREHLFKMLTALRDARAILEQAVRDGKVTQHYREQASRLAQFFNRRKA